MQSTIKSTLSLLISFGQAAGAGAGVRGDVDRSAPPLTLKPIFCRQRCLLSPLSEGLRANDGVMRGRDKVLADSLSAQIYGAQGEPDKSDRRGGGGGGGRDLPVNTAA